MHKIMIIGGLLFLGSNLVPGSAAADGISNPNFTAPPAKEGYSYPDCYCTDSTGKRVEIGQRACLKIGSREVLARCDISVNNPIWRQEIEGCPAV